MEDDGVESGTAHWQSLHWQAGVASRGRAYITAHMLITAFSAPILVDVDISAIARAWTRLVAPSGGWPKGTPFGLMANTLGNRAGRNFNEPPGLPEGQWAPCVCALALAPLCSTFHSLQQPNTRDRRARVCSRPLWQAPG